MQEKIDSNRNCGEESVSNKNNNQNDRTTKYSNFRSSTPERKNKIKGNIQIEKIFQDDVDKIMKNLFKDDNDDAANIISDNELDIITPHYIARSSKEKSDDKSRNNVNDVKIIHDTGVHKDQNIQKDTERMKNGALGNSKSTYTKNIDSDNNDTFENSTSAKDDDFDNSMTAKNDDCENMISANEDDSENMSAVKNDDFSNMIAATNDEFEKMTSAQNVDFDNLIDAMNSDFKNLRVAKDDTFEDLTAMENNDFDNFIPPNYHDFDNLKASKNNDFDSLKVLKDNALIKLKEPENVVDNDDFNQEANTKQTSSKHRILEKYKSRSNSNSNSKRSEILERFKALRAQKAKTLTDPPREVATNIPAANNANEMPPAYLYVPIHISGQIIKNYISLL